MPILTGGLIIEGAEPVEISGAGAPVAGTAEIQTLTVGGTPTGGTFRLSYDGYTTAEIPWSETNATLVANIDAALKALPNVGATGVATAVGTMTAGIGTVTLTFGSRKAVPTITLASNSMTGTAPTVAVTETTPGIDPTGSGAGGNIGTGGEYTDISTGLVYVNTGTAIAPTWTKIGTQV
jgi:hypothetical protein